MYRIDGKHQARRLQRLVQLPVRDAGLHGRIQIVGADPQHAVHLAQIDRDAAVHRRHVPLERCAGTERHDRCPRIGAQANHPADFVGRSREGDRVGGVRRMPGLAVRVMLAHGGHGREPRTEHTAEGVDERRRRQMLGSQ